MTPQQAAAKNGALAVLDVVSGGTGGPDFRDFNPNTPISMSRAATVMAIGRMAL